TCAGTRSTRRGIRSHNFRRRWSRFDAVSPEGDDPAREDRDPGPRRAASGRFPPTVHAPPVQRQADGEALVRRELRDPRRQGGRDLPLRGLLPRPAARPRGTETFGPADPSKLVLVDATSSQLLLPSREKHHIDNIDSLATIREAILAAMEAEQPGRIVVDSMEFLVDRFPKEDVLRLWRELIEAARAARTVICFLFINWTLMERELDEIRAMSDFVIEFQSSL